MIRFPNNFLWGAATSAYQVEGATGADGRGTSIWDTFAAVPGNIEDATSGDVTSDHYHRWREDVALMKRIGLKAYRFSIAWPRILPDGTRASYNEAGMAFYEGLVDALLDAGIEPLVTLYHWDLPQALEDAGGWPERATVDAFVDFADVVTSRLGDRVKRWITHNEPSIVAWLGYLEGVHAPGRTSWDEALAAAHHVLLSHGRALPVIRANSFGCEVGIALMVVPAEAASPSAADTRAYAFFEGMWNRWFLDPVFGRGYPREFVDLLVEDSLLKGTELAFVQDGDLNEIATATDFLGINCYSRAVLRSDKLPERDNSERTVFESDIDRTDMGWEAHPDALRRAIFEVWKEYGPDQIYVTENGAAYATGPVDGRVPDMRRQRYLKNHLRSAHQAIEAGAPLKGYFVWSLLDNFEWGLGFAKRFGLVWVDYETGERIMKDSAYTYRDIIKRGGLEEDSE